MGMGSPCGCHIFQPRHGVKTTAPGMMMNSEKQVDWFEEGYRAGESFSRLEADYDELAAIYRAGTIPKGWDIYRAEILNRHLGIKGFDFQSYTSGFARACIEFYEKI